MFVATAVIVVFIAADVDKKIDLSHCIQLKR